MYKIGNQIGQETVHNPASVHPVTSPLTGQVIGEVSYADPAMIDRAIAKAREAQRQWAQLTYKKRSEVLFAMRQQLQTHEDELAQIITQENGKSLAESRAAVAKAIELCEFAVSIPALIAGKTEIVSTGIEVKEMTFPVGVLACVTPFNFPMMVPMWTIPNALVCGNAVILKPSEATPVTAMKIAELFAQAGLPDGLLSVVNGEKEVVEALCDHPGIDALTFVGSTPVAKLVYKRATSNLKRCLAMGGAKNHILVTDEVNPEIVAKEITSAAYGMSGQRCMAASVVLAIGHCGAVIDQIIAISKQMVAGRDCPPLISRKAVEKNRPVPGSDSGDSGCRRPPGDGGRGSERLLYRAERDSLRYNGSDARGRSLWTNAGNYSGGDAGRSDRLSKPFAVWQRRFNLYRYRFVRTGSVAGLIQRHAGD